LLKTSFQINIIYISMYVLVVNLKIDIGILHMN